MLSVPEGDIDRITEVVYCLLKGRIPKPLELPEDYPENEVKQLVGYLNRFLAEYASFADSLFSLSRGHLDFSPPRGQIHVFQSLKNLHANLRHLTWKTQEIAAGDLEQTVDFMGDFSDAFNRMTGQLKEAFETIEQQNHALAEANEAIRREKDKAEGLLLNILPESVAEDLKERGHTAPQLFEQVTALFSDFVGFTKLSSSLSPQTLIDELNEMFTAFDELAEANHCERIKTIGDAYLAVCGMPEPNDGHAQNILQMAVGMMRYMGERNGNAAREWKIRIGIHSGPVVGAVVGVKKYIYDVFGDTINTASRMETCSEPMRINVSEATRSQVSKGIQFEERVPTEVKGKGTMRMYFVSGDGAGDS